MKKILFVFIVLFLIQGCINASFKKNENKSFVEYKLEDKNIIRWMKDSSQVLKIDGRMDRSLNLSEIIDTCKFVKLETNDNCLFGNIDKIRIDSTGIYIMDCKEAESIFRFDRNGHFLNKIGSAGRGPGEYFFPQDFDLFDGKVYVFNGNQSKIFKYSVDGVYLDEISLNLRCNAFSVLSSNKIVLYAENGYTNEHLGNLSHNHLFLIDKRGEIIDGDVKMDKRLKRMNFTKESACMVNQNNRVSFSPYFSNTIYEIQDTVIKLKYNIDLGKNEADIANLRDLNAYDIQEKLNSSGKVIFSGEHYETKKHLCFGLSIKNRIIEVIYDKNSRKIKYGSSYKRDGVNFLADLNFIGATKDYFIGSCGCEFLCELKKQLEISSNGNTPCKSNSIYKLIMESTPNDSPVLVFSSIKDFN